jgi:hypothetical protein
MTGLASKPALQAIIALIAALFSLRAFSSASLAFSPAAGRFPACHVRLRLLGPASGTAADGGGGGGGNNCSGAIAFGLLRNGCPVTATGAAVVCKSGGLHVRPFAGPGRAGLLDSFGGAGGGRAGSASCGNEEGWANGYFFEAAADAVEVLSNSPHSAPQTLKSLPTQTSASLSSWRSRSQFSSLF